MESRSCDYKRKVGGGAYTTEESRVTTAARHLLVGFADRGRRQEPRNAAPEAGKSQETDSARLLQKGAQP